MLFLFLKKLSIPLFRFKSYSFLSKNVTKMQNFFARTQESWHIQQQNLQKFPWLCNSDSSISYWEHDHMKQWHCVTSHNVSVTISFFGRLTTIIRFVLDDRNWEESTWGAELTMIDICEHLRNIDQAQPGFVFWLKRCLPLGTITNPIDWEVINYEKLNAMTKLSHKSCSPVLFNCS